LAAGRKMNFVAPRASSLVYFLAAMSKLATNSEQIPTSHSNYTRKSAPKNFLFEIFFFLHKKICHMPANEIHFSSQIDKRRRSKKDLYYSIILSLVHTLTLLLLYVCRFAYE
jgi:hypothetical protein